jgi:hypothetical protein
MRSLFLTSSALVALLLATGGLPAQDSKPAAKEPAPTQAEKIYQLLKERKDLEIKDQPLSKALELLSELVGTTFEGDPAVLQPLQAALLEFPVTLRGSKVAVGGTLHRALAPHGLTYVVLVDRVFVTTNERAIGIAMSQKVTGSIASETLGKALDELARYYGVSILLDPQSSKLGETKITQSRIQGASLEALVHVLASSAGLQAVRLDNLLYVTTPEKAKLLPKKLATIPPAPFSPMTPMGGMLGLGGGFGGALGAGGAFGLGGGGALGLGGGAGFMGALGVGGGAGFAGNLGMMGAFGAQGAPPPMPKPKPDPKKPSSALPHRFDLYRSVMAAPVPEKPKVAAEESPAQKIRKELNIPVTIELLNLPLVQAFNQLKEKTGVDFVLDRAVLDTYFMERTGGNGGIDNIMVTAKLNKTPLRRGLRKLLSEYDLGYVILGDHVLITTQSMTCNRLMRLPISIDVDKVPFVDALKTLARDTATNLVLDKAVAKEGQEKVSLQLEDVALETVVRLLGEQAGLKMVIVDNVLFVTSKTRAAEMREDPDFKPRPDPFGGEGKPLVLPGMGGGGAPPPAPPAAAPGGVVPARG